MVCRVRGGKIGVGDPSACMHAPVVVVIISRSVRVHSTVFLSPAIDVISVVPRRCVRVESECLKVCDTRA